MQRGRKLRLQRHDMGAAFHPGCHTADQATAPHADQQGVGQVARLLFQLQCQGARPCHHLGLVIGVGLQGASGLLARHTSIISLGVGCAGHDDLGSQCAQAGALGLRRHLGHKHLAAHAQSLGRSRHGNTGVAARGDDHAAVGHRIGQQAVQHAARLEAAAHLQMLQLQPDLCTVHPQGGAGQTQQRRAAQKMGLRGQALAGSRDGGAVDHAKGSVAKWPCSVERSPSAKGLCWHRRLQPHARMPIPWKQGWRLCAAHRRW